MPLGSGHPNFTCTWDYAGGPDDAEFLFEVHMSVKLKEEAEYKQLSGLCAVAKRDPCEEHDEAVRKFLRDRLAAYHGGPSRIPEGAARLVAAIMFPR